MKSTVIFSFLTTSRSAINAFVASAVNRITDYTRESNVVKLGIYQESFDLVPREKYTGFEKYSELDQSVRLRLSEYLGDRDTQVVYEEYNKCSEEPAVNFREALVEQAKTLKGKTNIVYLSGGIDSEIVAMSFIDAQVEFHPIIYTWIDSQGVVLNDFDTKFAVDFCTRNNLKPILCDLNIEQFWSSEEIFEYADKYLCSSPQILTYHKMVSLTDAKIKSGEIDLS
jgi:asparagine synthetase B (glutamine-hydrolysing)